MYVMGMSKLCVCEGTSKFFEYICDIVIIYVKCAGFRAGTFLFASAASA